jgi:hypothetical protein
MVMGAWLRVREGRSAAEHFSPQRRKGRKGREEKKKKSELLFLCVLCVLCVFAVEITHHQNQLSKSGQTRAPTTLSI